MAPVKLTRIVIDDDWAGLNPISPLRSHWVIEPHGSGYVLSGTHSQQRMATQPHYSRTDERDVTNVPEEPVSRPAVDALVRAMRAPPEPTIDLSLFGTAATHADKTIDETLQRLMALNPSPALRQRVQDWGNTLRNGQPLAHAITVGVATAFHTDDYPHIHVEASFADGSSLAFDSGSQNLFLLPWCDASGRKSFSADLPKALAALLPPMSTNRERLSGDPSQDEFDNDLQTGMADDYSRLQVQIVAPEAYGALASRFTIGDINPVDMSSHQVFVTVSLPGGPPNLSLRTRLDIKGTALAKPAELDAMMAALTTAAAATGLHQAMLSAPDEAFRMEHGIGIQPFHAEAKKQFIAQMVDVHKLPELAGHPKLLDGAVLVTQGGRPTYWVALRDHRAVAWKRYVGRDAANVRLCAGIPLSDKDFPSFGDSDECIGKVYDAAGKAL